MIRQKWIFHRTWRLFAIVVATFGLVQFFTLSASPLFPEKYGASPLSNEIQDNVSIQQEIEASKGKTDEPEEKGEISTEYLESSSLKYKTLNRKLKGGVAPTLQCVKDLINKVTNSSEPCGSRIVTGKIRPQRGLLTIGIPTTERPNAKVDYLQKTLDSLVSRTTSDEKNKITVIVLVTDFNNMYLTKVTDLVEKRYSPYADSGFIVVATVTKSIYPDLSLLDKDKPDSKERVVWRSKQNLDFASLFLLSYNISTFYLQLEDDVISARSFVEDISRFVNNQTKKWVCLEFSNLGFIGKLFRSYDLLRLSYILLRFYQYEPCDLLLPKFIRIRGQNGPIHMKPGLFQHIGIVSSLKNKMMPSIDSDFKDIENVTLPNENFSKVENPPAKIQTNIARFAGNHSAKYAYEQNSFFWAIDPKSGNFLQVLFEQPHNISRLIVLTGDKLRRTDALRDGELRVSRVAGTKTPCGESVVVGKFVGGDFDSSILGLELPSDIVCIIIKITKPQMRWLIIRQILVFASK